MDGLYVDSEGSKAGQVTLLDGGYVSNAQVQFKGKLIVDGGEVGTREAIDANTDRMLIVAQDGNLEVKSGKVSWIRWRNVGKSVVLSGGEFGKIESRYVEMLADGKGFQYTENGKTFKLSEAGNSITNVKVVDCSHEGTVDWNTTDGTCEHCGKQLYVAKVGENGYKSVKEAIERADYGTVTLLANSKDVSGVSLDMSSCTLDLNGHHFEGTIKLSTGDFNI